MSPLEGHPGYRGAFRAARVTLVSASAGWDNASLLGEWYAAERELRSFGWMALDRRGQRLIRFWTYVAAALRSVDAELGAAALALLPLPGIRPIVELLPVLINALAGAERRVVLVLDDYHVIVNPNIAEGMTFLVEHLPPAVEIVVATRAEPARLRVQGQLTEIGLRGSGSVRPTRRRC